MSTTQIPNKKELLKALKKLEKNPKDSIAILGEIGITVLGAGVVGFAVSAMGVTSSIPIITAVTGIVLIEATPIGWVATAAVAGGTAAYGLTQAVKHGSKMEAKKAQLKRDLEQRLKDIEQKEKRSKEEPNTKDLSGFYNILRRALDDDRINTEDTFGLLQAISSQQMSLSDAYKLVNDILNHGKLAIVNNTNK